MASSLKIIATPIGNIRDITLRALDEIKRADVIFAEDTRHTLKLIQALSLELKAGCRLISCDSHKEKDRIKVAIENLLANKQVIVISDAGCPTISDPGSLMVQGVVEQGLKVEVIPGPSAMTAALMGAGLDVSRFVFLGFLPQKKQTRASMILDAGLKGFCIVMYEASHRISDLLTELYEHLGDQRVVIARELTKLHETFHRGILGQALNPPLVEKGECVVVVEISKSVSSKKDDDSENDLESFIEAERLKGISAKDIARLVAQRFGIKKSQAYEKVLRSMGT